jgi:hypothetical protein
MFLKTRSMQGYACAIVVAFAGLLHLSAPRAFAQQVAVAGVAGTVTDSSGAPIAGAEVKIVDTGTDQAHTTTSGPAGNYEIPNIPVGSYRLEVRFAGFKAYVQKGIILEVGSNITQNVKLEVGDVTQSIEVTADAAMVETKENAIAQVINQEKIVALPLNGRNPTQLLQLAGAGTSTPPAGNDLTGSKNMGGSNASGTFSVAGSQANGINYLLDGGDNNDAFSNVNLPIPFPDAIEEFSVMSNGLPAQYGLHPGGTVNIITKSGTNGFHGDLFEFLRNGDFNARQEGTLVRDTLKRSQYGGTAGGRIIKDKLFYFGGYQGTRQRSDPAAQIAYVPTAAALQGNFSVLDAATSAGGCLTTARTLKNAAGQPYVGNIIPTSQFDPAGLKLASTYLPVSSDPCGKYYFGYLANNPDDQWIGKVDYAISAKQALFARYYIYDYTAESLFDGHNALTTGTAGNMERSQTMTVGDTYTFTPNRVNSFHVTFDRRRDNRGDAPNLFSPKDLGVNMYVAIPNYTQLSVTNYSGSGFNVGCGTCAPGFFDINTYQLADDFTWIRGRHQIGFGVDVRKDQFNSVNNQQDNGQFTFNGGTTGDGLADLLIGRFSGLTDGNALSDYLRQTVFAMYVQDAYKVTNHFSVNLGLRWEPSIPSYDKYGRGNRFDETLFQENWHSTVYPNAPAGLVFSGDTSQNPYGKYLTASHYGTFSPRLGLVWDPNGDGRQTIRAAFSLMHETTELFYPERWTTNPPYASSLTLTSGQFSNPFASYVAPNGATGDPFPGAGLFPVAGTYVSIPSNVKPTYVMQWNLSYQRQLGRDWLVTANYLGNASRHIWGSVDVNYSVYTGAASTTSNTNQRRLTYLANPAQGQYYSDIQTTDDGNNGEYHGLLLSAQHRLANHFTMLSNFTWSHCTSTWDFGGELAGTLYQNPTNRNGERGACSYDHRLNSFTSIVATSGGMGSNPLLQQITKNWQLSPIIGLLSGQPLTLTDGGKDISLSGQLQDRPNVVQPGSVYPSNQTVLEWFNPAAFAIQPTGTFGNLGRDAIYGPGTIQFDVSLSRRFQFRERYRVDFRSDFFNILNHGNWSNPTTSIASGTFGQITTFGSPRQIQLAMKLFF